MPILVTIGSERPFNEITNSIKWDAANVGGADKAPFSIWIVVEIATRAPTVLCANNGHRAPYPRAKRAISALHAWSLSKKPIDALKLDQRQPSI